MAKLNELTLRTQERHTLAVSIWTTILLNRLEGKINSSKKELEQISIPFLLKLIHVEYPQLSNSDIYNLAKLVNTFRTSMSESIDISEFADLIYDEFCNEVFDKYSLDLRDSKQLTHNLKIHIEYMMRRIESGLELKNPLIAEIKTKYPYAYEISTLMVHILYKYRRFYLPDDELSFITIYVEHFLVNEHKKLKAVLICSQRSSIQSIIHHWLERHFFNQIEVIAVVEEVDFNLEQFESVDLVIGHPHLPRNLEIESFRFAGLPSDKDITTFYNILHTIKNRTRLRKLIKNLFDVNHIKIYHESIEFDDLIRCLSSKFKNDGIISNIDLFVEDILNREVHYPSYLVPNVMIPHPLFTFSSKNAVAVALIKKPNSPARLVFLLALTKNRTEEVNALFQYFKFLAIDANYIQRLGSAQNAQDLLEKIYELPDVI